MYTVTYVCGNCGSKFKVSYDKGTKAQARIKCENCGCYEAVKTWPSTFLRGHKSTQGKWKLANPYDLSDVAKMIRKFTESKTGY